ncbi:hypothetical protein NDU88_001321 [Pleurodeles waltl]|uniref:Uncharacterized protein n=1 Tax=Pleurodeles waltl TaxID=8319 RepID=A0AAV7THI8_PLEWA|nr:hypothetical protein NDU88_001321 [Pleurodeles waltl]
MVNFMWFYGGDLPVSLCARHQVPDSARNVPLALPDVKREGCTPPHESVARRLCLVPPPCVESSKEKAAARKYVAQLLLPKISGSPSPSRALHVRVRQEARYWQLARGRGAALQTSQLWRFSHIQEEARGSGSHWLCSASPLQDILIPMGGSEKLGSPGAGAGIVSLPA